MLKGLCAPLFLILHCNLWRTLIPNQAFYGGSTRNRISYMSGSTCLFTPGIMSLGHWLSTFLDSRHSSVNLRHLLENAHLVFTLFFFFFLQHKAVAGTGLIWTDFGFNLCQVLCNKQILVWPLLLISCTLGSLKERPWCERWILCLKHSVPIQSRELNTRSVRGAQEMSSTLSALNSSVIIGESFHLHFPSAQP